MLPIFYDSAIMLRSVEIRRIYFNISHRNGLIDRPVHICNFVIFWLTNNFNMDNMNIFYKELFDFVKINKIVIEDISNVIDAAQMKRTSKKLWGKIVLVAKKF